MERQRLVDKRLTGGGHASGAGQRARCGGGALADRFHLATWSEVGDILCRDGPAGLIGRVRAAESGDPRGRRWPRGKIHDDATAVFWAMPGQAHWGTGLPRGA